MHNTYSKAILPIEIKDQTSESEDSAGEEVNIQSYIERMIKLRKRLFKDAKSKITEAQFRHKQDNDKKRGTQKVNR